MSGFFKSTSNEDRIAIGSISMSVFIVIVIVFVLLAYFNIFNPFSPYSYDPG